MKEKIINIAVAVVALALFAFLTIAGIVELVGKSNRVTVDCYAAKTVNEKKSIFPPAADQYYYGYSYDVNKKVIYVVRTDRNWTETKFDGNSQALFGKETVTAYKKRLSKGIQKRITSKFSEEELKAFPLGTAYYLDNNYVAGALFKIVSALLFVASAALYFWCILKEKSKKWKILLPAVSCFVAIAFAFYGLW